MNPFRSVAKAVGRVVSVGVRLWARMLMAGSSLGYFPGWTQNRYAQVQAYRGWVLVAIEAIGKEVARSRPQVAYVVEADEVEEKRASCLKRFGRAGLLAFHRKFLSGRSRRKAIADLQPHEDMELVSSTHPLVKLLRNPNPKESAWSFYFKIPMYHKLAGNVYLWRVRNKLGKTVELWHLPPQWVYPRSGKDQYGEDQIVAWYDIRPSGGFGVTGTVKFWADEVIHIPAPHPESIIDGFATTQGIGEWVDGSIAIDRSRRSRFENGPLPGGVVEIDAAAHDPSEQTVKRFKADFRAAYGGYERHGDVMVLGPGMKFVPGGNSPVEMDWFNSFDQYRDSVLAAFGVGKSQVGITEEVNFASMAGARANFIFSTVNPLLELLSQVFTRELAHDWDETLCVFWPDASPDDRAQTLAEYIAAQGAGGVTPNDWRQNILHLEPYPDGRGDDPLLSMGMAPFPLTTGEEDLGLDLAALQALGRAPAEQQEQPEEPGQTPGETPGRLAAALGNGHKG